MPNIRSLDDEPHALFLCNKTVNAPEPWTTSGVKCISVDINCESRTDGLITWDQTDVRDYLPPLKNYVFACAFPPCTHTAVSGRAWFKKKGLRALKEAIEIFDACERICKWTGAPYFIENPVSTFSTYRGKPDYMFHPFEYTGWHVNDNYTKKTCLWTGNDFVMPESNRKDGLPPPDDRINKVPASPHRSDFRSISPKGFSYAVYLANRHVVAGRKPK